MVRRGNHNGINIRTSEELTKVVVRGASLVPVMLVDNIFGFLTALGANIANGNDPNIRVPHKSTHIRGALTTHTDTAHYDAIARGTIGST
jgi:hypothetical protein